MAKSLSSREIIKVLLENGFVLKNIEGSHYRYDKAEKRTTVKHPQKDVPCKTFQSILRQSGLCKEDFYRK